MRLANLLCGVLAAAGSLAAGAAHAVDPGSQLIGCGQANTRVTIAASSHLDPSCTWTRGVDIVASNVVLDCQGAQIVGGGNRVGILVTAPTDVALSNVTVRNCHVENFLNGLRVTREGFRDLVPGQEYEHAYANIAVEDSTFRNSRGVGIFIDGYVTGVTLRRLHVEGAGSSGIYLDAGSKDTVVEDDTIVNNGFRENGPFWQPFDLGGGVSVWFWGIGREGLSIDGSRYNVVRNNTFSGNSAGGIFLYKNCGEFVNQRPDRWWQRYYGADGNLIENNTFVGGTTGVWIGSRMGENVAPMDCSDPQYAPGYALDFAADNTVRANTFTDVSSGVRVEDDRAVIADNVFTGTDAGALAVLVGTPQRTAVLGRPVDGTTITGNTATIAGNANPYRWAHGLTNTVFTGNRSAGRVVGFCQGPPAARGPFVFTVAFALSPTEPTDPPAPIPPPTPQPPCPLACDAGAGLAKPQLALRRLDTPPGDDRLKLAGQVLAPHPFDPALDPAATGAGIVVADATGARLVDVTIPGGAYDAGTGVGWKTSAGRGTWKYANRSAAPVGGITRVSVQDLSKRTPGLVKVTVEGKRGAYGTAAAPLPLRALVVLDPPTAETGQCGTAAFAGAGGTCTASAAALVCR